VSPNAILLDETDQMKKAVVSPHLVPDTAVVDPFLTLSVPSAVTAATGLDALTHCIEAYANKFAHPAVDLYALEGIRLISANLLRAVRNGADVEARGALALGSLYGGLCLGPVNTAAVHALAYPLGGKFHVAHGVSNAVLLPEVLRFNLPHAAERYATVARAMGVEGNGPSLSLAQCGVERLAHLAQECGVPQRLSELGVPREAIPSMAEAAMQVTRLLKNNPRPVTEQAAVGIYEAIY
jgi:alcohol dehydrogenase class IV